MLKIRRETDRGRSLFDWLDSSHSFSFGQYHDPEAMGFRDLRVLNEDRVAPGGGFQTHSHRDMEIVTLVLAGELRHQDSLGNGSTLRPGDVQRMSAGRGVTHSEVNASEAEEVHFLQVWFLPRESGVQPSYAERSFEPESRRGELTPVITPDGRGGTLTIGQDVSILLADLEPGQSASHSLEGGRHGWVQVVTGAVRVNGHELTAGDGVALSDEAGISLEALEDSSLVVFDLR